MSNGALRIVAPWVVQVSASVASARTEHVVWSVGYAPEVDEDDEGRYLLARFHAGNPEGRVEVEVAALQIGGPEGVIHEGDEQADFERTLANSEALETLFDFARMAASTALGMLSVSLALPLDSPEVEITRLVRASNVEEKAE